MISFQDVFLAVRRLRRAPWFSAFAVGMLSVAIGAALTVFGLVQALFLDTLPVADPSSLVAIYQSRDGAGHYPMSFRDFEDVRDGSRLLADVAAHYPSAPLSLRTEAGQREVNGSVVTANYFPLLGLRPALGRFFRADEDATPGTDPVAVISHRLWQTRFGGDDVVGASLDLNGTVFEVVGVAPSGFTGLLRGLPSDVWIPSRMARVGYRWCGDPFGRDCTYLIGVGRLAPGRSLEELHAEMAVLGDAVDAAHHSKIGLRASSLDGIHPDARAEVRNRVGLLSGVVFLVLLVAATNLGGLLAGRGIRRRGEVATRLALGADRARVASLFVTESGLLSVAGMAGGLAVAFSLRPLASLFHPGGQPVPWLVDGRFLGFGLGLALLLGVGAGMGPGWRAAGAGLSQDLKRAPRTSGLGVLAAVQVAITVCLLIGAGLLGRSLTTFDRVGGVEPEQLVTLRSRPRLVGMEPAKAQEFHRQVMRRLEARPDVRAVAMSKGLPPFRFFSPVDVAVTMSRTGEGVSAEANYDLVSPGLFEALGLALRRGRGIEARDVPGSAPIAVINEVLADRLFAGSDPIGESLRLGERSYEVVGVVADGAYSHAGQATLARVFLAYWQDADIVDARITVRLAARLPAATSAEWLQSLRTEFQAVDPSVPVTEVGTFGQRLERQFAPVYAAGRLVAASSVVTLGLAAMGVYALLSLWVGGRIREIGIRRALGGRAHHIVGGLMKQACVWMMPAVAAGTLAAWLAAPRLANYLYGVRPHDPATFLMVPLAVIVMAAMAAGHPARRACRVEPTDALRHE